MLHRLGLTRIVLSFAVAAFAFPGCDATEGPPGGGGGSAVTIPAAPTGLTAVASSSTTISLNWTVNSNNETGFEVYRSTDGGVTFTLIATTVAAASTFTDSGLTPSTAYTYEVRAVNTAGGSAFAGPATTTTLPALAPPTNLAGSVTAATTITLTWTYGAVAPSNFLIEHSSDGINFTQIGSVAGTVLTFADTAAVAGSNFYRVRAQNSGPPIVNSAYSNIINVALAAPVAATSLTAVANSSHSIKLTWADNSSNETFFKILRSFSGSPGTFTQIAQVAADTTSYTDSGLFPLTTYYYIVVAHNFVGDSPNSNTAFATTFSGDWIDLGGSGSSQGLSNSATPASQPSVATDKFGRAVVVWQEEVLGVDQIYMAVWDTNVNPSVGNKWLGVMVNGTMGSETLDSTTGFITAVTWSFLQRSNQGNGISLAAGNAQNPMITYNGTLDAFFIVWQEYRAGAWQIVARKMSALTFQAVLGFYRATFSDSTVTDSGGSALAEAAPNDAVGDNQSTVASTIVVSTPGQTCINPQAFLTTAELYVVWQAFAPMPAPTLYQIYLAQVDVVTFVVAAVGTFAGKSSNDSTGGGISNTPSNSEYPSITASGTNIYVCWQTDLVLPPFPHTPHWAVYSRNNTIAAPGVWGATDPVSVPTSAAAGGISNDAGDAQHPKCAVDKSGFPYVTWDDNTANSSNYEIYIKRQIVLAGAFTAINDSVGTPNSAGGGGVSNSPGSSQFPSITIDGGNNVYLAWQDSSNGNWAIYVKQYSVAVPLEGPAWVALGASAWPSAPAGVSNDSGSANLPSISVDGSGVVYLTWEDNTSGTFEVLLRRW